MVSPVVDRLVEAINSRDIEALVGCFAPSFSVTWPVHPARSFEGPEQVRRNWAAMFEKRPNIQAKVTSYVTSGTETWGEWEFASEEDDGTLLRDRGVIIVTVEDNAIMRSRFYMEPVDE